MGVRVMQVTENGRECFAQIRNPADNAHGVDMYVTLHKEGPVVDLSINDNGIVVTIPELSFRNVQNIATFLLDARRELMSTYRKQKQEETK